MSYTRKFQRYVGKSAQGTNESFVGEELARKDKHLSRRVMSALLSGSFLLQPFTAIASTISRLDNEGNLVNLANGPVTDIFAQKIVGNAAVNAFKEYKLDAGHIANMYFKTEQGGVEKSALVNFVDSRIDINGTVNAIQNNKIGGKLFFLSKEGMAVGKSGVINTGSLYVATPTKKAYEAMTGYGADKMNKLINTAADAKEGFVNIPINKSGTISVLGKINAADEVHLRAAHVGVGKNIGTEAIDGVAAGQAVEGAIIQTGITDFGDLVNIKDRADAGLKLKASEAGNGDIILSAYNSYNDNHSQADSFTDGKGEEAVAELVVAKGNTINAAGDVRLTATAVNNVVVEYDETGKSSNGYDYTVAPPADSSNKHFYGQIVKTKADISVDGTVIGDEVSIKANAHNKYHSADQSLLSMNNITSIIGAVAGGNFDAAYGKLSSEATVTIGENADVQAKSDVKTIKGTNEKGEVVDVKVNALDITADSTTDLAVGASTTLLKVYNAGYNVSDKIPGAGVTYADTNNKAIVDIKGKVDSAAHANISAHADTKLDAAATATTVDIADNSTLANLAVNIVNGNNESKVIISGKGDKGISADGDVNVEALSTNNVNILAAASGTEKSILATSVAVVGYDSKADILVDGKVESTEGDVDINASSGMLENNFTVTNQVGSSMMMKSFVQGAMGSQTVQTLLGQPGPDGSNVGGYVGAAKDWLATAKYTPNFIKKKLTGPSDPNNPDALQKAASLVSAGAGVGIINESNNTSVTITKNASVEAKGDVNVIANSKIADTKMAVTGGSYNYDNKVDNAALVNVSVLVSDMENNSTVVIEGGEKGDNPSADKYAQITSSNGNVNVEAKSAFEYGRLRQMIRELDELCDIVEAAYTNGNDEYSAAVADLRAKAEAYDEYITKNTERSDADYTCQEFTDMVNAAQAFSDKCSSATVPDQIKNIFVGPVSVVGAAAKFANPNNYVNFSAGSSNGGKKLEGGKPAAKVAVAGSANVNFVSNNSSVLVGKNSKLTADKTVDLKATSSQTDVAFNGKLGLNGGADNAVGGIIGIQVADANSLVTVAEGVELSGNNVKASAENDINHIGITFGAGMSGNVGVTGMFTYMGGNSNSIVNIDDEAKLTAKVLPNITADVENGAITISALNDTDITAVSGGAAIGKAAGIGISVGLVDYDRYTYASVADNDGDMVGKTVSVDKDGNKVIINRVEKTQSDDEDNDELDFINDGKEDKVGSLQRLTNELTNNALEATTDLSGANTEEAQKQVIAARQNAFYGTYGSDQSEAAGITGSKVAANAKTDGTITNVSVAGGIVTGDDSGQVGFIDKASNFFSNTANKVTNPLRKLDNKVSNKLGSFIGKVKNEPNLKPTDQGATASSIAGQDLPKFSIDGAGSVSVNIVNGDTGAILEGAKITAAKGTNDTLKVQAQDSSLLAAASGAAAIAWKTVGSVNNASSKTVGFAGAAAVNRADTDVVSLIRNSTVTNMDAVTNVARKDGALVAAGLGMSLQKNGGDQGFAFSGAGSTSVNIGDNDIAAVMENNTVSRNDNETTALGNYAFDSDTQVTGGVNASIVTGGETGVAAGATVTYAAVKNNVQSQIIGGQYTELSTADVEAITDITQVGAAVSLGVAIGGQGSNYAFEGAAAYNSLDNNVDAVIDGASITTQKINVAAKDADLDKNYDKYINERGLDATGQSYMDNVKSTKEDGKDEAYVEKLNAASEGNVIVTTAVSVAASTGGGGGAGGASVSISDINNDFNATVKNNANITATGGLPAAADIPNVNIIAKSNTTMVGVAAGGTGTSQKAGVGGSVTWETLDNNIEATIEDSTIKSNSVNVNALSESDLVNVAGQISVGKNAVGLAVAYNSLENNTGAYIKGSILEGIADDKGVATPVDVDVAAANEGDIYAVGASVAVSTDGYSVNGVMIVNQGKNDIEAVVDGSEENEKTTIKNAKSIDVKAQDKSGLLAVTVGGGAIGGSIAYNQVGGLKNADKQANAAMLNNANITMAEGGVVNVEANEETELQTIAIGVGIAQNTAAVQGAAATSQINKKNEASMTGTTINEAEGSQTTTKVDVKANSVSKTTNSANVASVSFGGGATAAIGAGVSVNETNVDTKAFVSGGTQKVQDLVVEADSVADILNVGVGGSVSTGPASITGSVAVNQINNNVTANIGDGANVVADNNVVVVAKGDEQIANYAGSLSVTPKGAAVGVSVSVNQIDSIVDASITGNDTKITAYGKGEAAKVDDKVDDNKILDAMVDEKTFQSHKNLGDDRTDSAYHGVAVSASGTHSLKSFLANISGTGTGAAVTGTVNVNTVDGKTTAAIRGADVVGPESFINGELDYNNDVSVIAHDYTNSAGVVGSVGVAGTGAGVGLGSDTNTVSRTVSAQVVGKGSENADGEYEVTGQNEIDANKFKVEADAKQGISSLTTGIAVAGIGAGVANSTSVALLKGKTEALVQQAHVTAQGFDVLANRTGKLNTLGTVVGGAGVGAGVGVGVSVLNENSDTSAVVDGVVYSGRNSNGKVNVKAENSTKVNYHLYSVGGGLAGAAGSIGVANVNSKVTTLVQNSELGQDSVVSFVVGKDENGKDIIEEISQKAGDINISGKNTIDFENKSGSLAGGAVGVGVGVSVNTIDSQVKTTVENSKLYSASDVNITAEESRTVEQMAVNAAGGASAAVGANVMITNVGKQVESAYGSNLKTDADGKVTSDEGVDIDAVYVQAKEGVNGNRLSSEYVYGWVDTTKVETATVGKGTADEDNSSMVKAHIDGASIDADNTLNVKATEETNVTMDGISAQAGLMGSANGTVGILDVKRNSGVEITSAKLEAAKMMLAAEQRGKSELNIYQGTLGGVAAIGAAYGSVASEGKTGVGIGNSTLVSTEGIGVSAADSSQTEVNAIGVAVAAAGAASVVVAQGENNTETTIDIDTTTMDTDGGIVIDAKREPVSGDSLKVSAIAGSGGLVFAGAGVGATATEMGKVGIGLTGNTFKADGDIAVDALNAPKVNAHAGAIAGSILASAAITYAGANIGSDKEHLETIVNIGADNSFAAGTKNGAGKIDINGKTNATQTVNMEGLSIGIGGSVQANVGEAKTYSDVEVDIAADNTFSGNYDKTDETAIPITADVNIDGSNTVTQTLKASGISAGGYFSSGTNISEGLARLNTTVNVKGSSDDSQIDDLVVKAANTANMITEAHGDGGSLVDISPNAAEVENNYNAVATVNMSGKWDTTGKVDVSAINGQNIDLLADAVRATVVGGSGVWLDNRIDNTATVNIENAEITSEDAQKYLAQNKLDYKGDVKGSGYGGISINGSAYDEDIDAKADVNIKDSTLKGTGDAGSITAEALTTGSVFSKNQLQSAGVIPVSVADSEHHIDFVNKVTTSGDTSLTTAKKDQDITLAASDNTQIELDAIADTQGGGIGAASSDLTNTMNRSNTITVANGTFIESSNDVNLYAGTNAKGEAASLDMGVTADAYNKTAIPLCTVPDIDNTMSQNNQVEAGGSVNSVRDINAKANKGDTILVTSAREYNIYTGNSGTGSIASTADGTINEGSAETHNNFVNVTGQYNAGIHNRLDIVISGETKTVSDGVDAEGRPINGRVDYSGVEIKIGEYDKEGNLVDAQSWFVKDDIKPETLEIANTLLGEYNALVEAMNDYKQSSNEYKNLRAAADTLLKQMKELNLVEMRKENGVWVKKDIPVESMTIQGISLPDIIVSGGSISVEADNLKGSGSMTAKGAPMVNITNSSDLYLKVDDLTIKGNGGRITLNDRELTSENKGGFGGSLSSDGITGDRPQINITTTSGSTFTNNPLARPDIGIYGDLSNVEGDITIKNSNYNIIVDEDAVISAQNVKMIAEKGSVSQTSTKGILNINGDPIAQYQFGEKVAEKIQKKLHTILLANGTLPSFENYDAYLWWLVNDVGIDPKDLGIKFDEKTNVDWIKVNNNTLNSRVTKELVRDLVEADGKEFRDFYYTFGFYNKYKDKVTDEMIAAEIATHKTNGGAWYDYLTNTLDIASFYIDFTKEAITKEVIIDKSGGVLAGNNVYINAINVNINGLVQAGYGNYSVKLNDQSKVKVSLLDNSWNGETLLDSQVMSAGDKYVVNANGIGGAVYNEATGVWDYEVKVYYNPSTKKLLVDGVAPNGGQIYINGAVSSSGDGRLRAMDGAANIDIDTTALAGEGIKINEVVVNEIANKDIEGLISITDTNRNLVTEYKNGLVREYKIGTSTINLHEFTANTGKIDANGNASYTYDVLDNMRYQYTGGYEAGQTNYYSYKDYFIAWGLIDYSSSDELMNKITAAGNANKIVTDSKPTDGSSLNSGIYIGVVDGANNANWSVTGSKQVGAEVAVGDVVEHKEYGWHKDDAKKDPTWLGEWWGYGRVRYEWVTKNTTSSTTTSSVKADYDLDIGFVGGKANEGNIKVTANQNINLVGNIANATKADGSGMGYVQITSNDGAITSAGNAYILSDDVKLKAQSGIKANHLALGKDAKINLVTDSGNIDFVSKNGNLNLVQAITGGAGPITQETGNVSISARGSILNGAGSGVAVKGQRIDLASDGSIGTKDNVLKVQAGSEMYSGDTMASSVNASAQGDIVMTQAEGNMRLGQVYSTDGDVVLTVENGSFVDAYNSGSEGSNDTADKLQRWRELGLISDEELDADSSDKAAEEAKKARLEGLTSQALALAEESGGKHNVSDYTNAAEGFAGDKTLQAAKAAYTEAVLAANGDADKIKAAYADYKAAKDTYFNEFGTQFTAAEREHIANYAEVSISTDYGWSQNQLLYAIQESVINSQPDSKVANTIANVRGNNITLNADKGGVGVDAAAKDISYDELAQLDNLKILAAARAGDLTWKDSEGKVVVKQQRAINLEVNNSDGQVNVIGKENVYLSGIEGSTLNITGVKTEKDIKLQADNGVYMVGNNQLIGRNLIIAGGDGSVGTQNNAINTKITGTLDATAGQNIYLTQIEGDLVVQNANAGDDIVLTVTNGDMLMSSEEGKDMGYIGSQNAGTIDLKASGSLGTASGNKTAIRIDNTGAVVNADASEVYLYGENNGNLVLGTVTSDGAFAMQSEGSVSVGREEQRNADGEVIAEAVAGTIQANESGSITTVGNIDLGTSAVTINSENGTGTLNMSAGGSITQKASADGIKATNVNLSSGKEQQLWSEKNQIAKLTVSGLGVSEQAVARTGERPSIDGVVQIKSDIDSMEVIVKDEIVGDVEIENLQDKGSIAIQTDIKTKARADGTHKGDINITAKGDVTTAEGKAFTADNDVVIKTEDGSIYNASRIVADGNVTMEAKDKVDGRIARARLNGVAGRIENTADITARTGNVTLTADDSIVNSGVITANGNAELKAATGSVNNTATVTAEIGDVTLTADDSVVNSGVITAKGNAQVKAATGSVNNTANVEATDGDIIMTAKQSIDSTGDIYAGTNVTVNADEKHITLTGNAAANTGKILLRTANQTDTGAGAITVKGNLLTNAESEAGGIDVITNKGNITFEGSATVSGKGTLNVKAEAGNITQVHSDNNVPEVKPEAGGKLQSINGSVDIFTKNGELDIHEIYALNKAGVGSTDGNMDLCKIDGNIVAIVTKDMENSMHIKDLTAGNQLIVSGNKINLDDIKQRENVDNLLAVDLTSANPKEATDTLNMNFSKVNNGVLFDRVWANKAEVHVNADKFYIDRVSINDVAHFSSNNMATAVYGTPPQRDGSDSIYWFNVVKHDPADNVDIWLDKDKPNYGQWMNLYFGKDGKQQISNGVLISLKDYFYVYNQRFTGEDVLRERQDNQAHDAYVTTHNPFVSYYERYDLYDVMDVVEPEARIVVEEDDDDELFGEI